MTEKIVKPARRTGWEIALVETLARHQAEPFVYGQSDCLIRVADVALAMTGIDPMADLRGTYDSEAGAIKAMKEKGFRSIEAVLAATFTEIAPAKARRGDCGLIETTVGGKVEKAAVIVLGDMVMGAAEPASDAERDQPAHKWARRDQLVKAYRIG